MIKARFGSDIDRIVNRLFPRLASARVSPDVLTILGVAAAALSGLSFAFDGPLLAGLLMIAAGLCDVADGIVARAQGSATRAGGFFDSAMDRISDLMIFSGMAVSFATRAEAFGVALVCWALSASVMTSYTRARAEVELRELHVGWMERGERFIVLILGALTGFLTLALVIVAIGASVTTAQRMTVARRRLSVAARAEDAEERPAPGALRELRR